MATNVIEMRGVTKRYGHFELRDVSFALPPGVIMGLIGPNGAGKTTIVKLVLDLVRPEAGEISVFGMHASPDGAAIRSRIGFVHEVPAFYDHLSLKALGSVVARFYPSWDPDAYRRLLEEFELPPGKRFGGLSRGMRTKAAIAIALAHRAELLLFDEPTSGLDPIFRHELLERLSGSIADGRTSVLFSTHLTNDLERIADYVTFVQEGRLVFSSTRDEVMDRWALVRGGLDLLDSGVRGWLLGFDVNPHGFVGLTDDAAEARRRFRNRDVIVERPTLEDICFYTGRKC